MPEMKSDENKANGSLAGAPTKKVRKEVREAQSRYALGESEL